MISEYLRQHPRHVGEITELAYSYMCDATASTEDANIEDHYDFITKDGTTDVKGPKKINRQDMDFSKTIFLAEGRNKRGNDGWLYGKADKISQLIESGDTDTWVFLEIRRQELEDYTTSKYGRPGKDLPVKDDNPVIGKWYRRYGNDDAIIYLNLADMIDNVNTYTIWDAVPAMEKAIEHHKKLIGYGGV